MAEMPGPYDVRAYACVARGVATHTCTMAPYRGVSRPVITFAIERLMDKAAAAFDLESRRNPQAQSDRPISLHVRHRARVRRRQLSSRPWRKPPRMWTSRQFRAQPARGARRAAAISASASQPFPSAPATAVRPSPRAAWRSRPGWETVEIAMDPSGCRRSAHRRKPARPRACAPRLPKSSPTKSASRRSTCASCTAIPTARPTAGARSPAARWSLPAARHCWRRSKIREKLLAIASHVLEAAADDIVLENGSAKVSGTDRAVPIAALARAAYHQTHQLQRRDRAGLARKRRLRSARHLLQCLSRRDRRGRYRDRPRRAGKISSWWRMPAASSIR